MAQRSRSRHLSTLRLPAIKAIDSLAHRAAAPNNNLTCMRTRFPIGSVIQLMVQPGAGDSVLMQTLEQRFQSICHVLDPLGRDLHLHDRPSTDSHEILA